MWAMPNHRLTAKHQTTITKDSPAPFSRATALFHLDVPGGLHTLNAAARVQLNLRSITRKLEIALYRPNVTLKHTAAISNRPPCIFRGDGKLTMLSSRTLRMHDQLRTHRS
jgi:hypothetical protein